MRFDRPWRRPLKPAGYRRKHKRNIDSFRSISVSVFRKLVMVLALSLVLIAGLSPRPASSAPTCDYSFILRQPSFQLVAPEESSVNAPLVTPLGIASENGDFKPIQSIKLIPDKGNPLTVTAKFKMASGKIATMTIPELSPSTTYDLLLYVRTAGAPTGGPRTVTEHIARFTTESSPSLDAIALQHAKAAAPPQGKPNGPDIFENALKELRSLEYPPYVSFLITTRSTVNGKAFVESFRSSVRSSDDYVSTHSVPVASTNKPQSPYGWNINIPILSQLFRNRTSHNHEDPFGVPQMSPLYAFGLRPAAPAEFSRVRPMPTASSDIKTLGRIRAVGRDYDATLLGTEPYFARYVYHLKLTPLGDPKVYRIREAWVDTQAFVIWHLRVDGIFENGPATTVPWDVYYTLVNGHLLVALESTNATVHTGGFWSGTPDTDYYGISYRFSDFVFPENASELDFFNELKTDAVQY